MKQSQALTIASILRDVPKQERFKRSLVTEQFLAMASVITKQVPDVPADTDKFLSDVCEAQSLLFHHAFARSTQHLPPRVRNELIQISIDYFIVKIKELYINEFS